MKLNLPTNACDVARLESYLRGDLSAAEEREFARHLDTCDSCRRAVTDRAAEPALWREIGSLLRPTQFDAGCNSAQQPSQLQHVLDALGPTDDPAMLGRLGGYEISGIVGAGGMGVVLKAIDKSLDRTVAIKVLAPHLATSGAPRKRFAREAKAAAAVIHPNVIAIHSVSNDEALPYLVMPYLRGSSLQKRLDSEGPLSLQEILRIGAQIAAGLAAAHAQGLVHRDIKPANILLEDGVERVTITDFGLARAVDDATITHSGAIAGTPQYMSPEQARGEPVDARSDLFSLGSVLYAIATGRPPFRAETSYGVMRRITDDEPKPIRELNPDVPSWLCVIITRLMSKQASDRFASAAEVSNLLEQCLAHVQQPGAVPLPASLVPQIKRGRFVSALRPWLGVITMLAAIGFGLLGLLAWQATEAPDIAGNWTGPEWGEVVLKKTADAEYVGTYSSTFGKQAGELQLKWSRIERRYYGTWREGDDRLGELSIRLVGDEIRGAHTTDPKSQINPATPRLADLAWTRSKGKEFQSKVGPAATPEVTESQTHLTALKFTSAESAVKVLQTFVQENKYSSRIVADGRLKAVILSGPAEEIRVITALLQRLDDGAEKTGGPRADNPKFEINERSVAAGDPRAKQGKLEFSETHEVVLSMDGLKFMLDLDTGKTMDAPAMIGRAEQPSMDLQTDQFQPYHYPKELIGLGLQGVEVKASDWDISAAEVKRVLSGNNVEPLKQMDLGPEKHPTYFFKTRDGALGVLQLLEIVDMPKGIRLRYKTIKSAAAEPDAQLRPKLLGRVTAFIHKGEEFVEISLGADQGLKVGDSLTVFRDDTYLGKITVLNLMPDNSVARVESRKGEIRGGESVVMGSLPAAPAKLTAQVRIEAPEEMLVAIADDQGGFADSPRLKVPARLDLAPSKVYRLKVTNIPGRPGAEFYPTVGLAPTTPSTEAFLAHNSTPFSLTEEDFDQVVGGKFVTKVIYLPDPEAKGLALGEVETIVSTRLDPERDPIMEADRRGSILAVVRLGNKDLEIPKTPKGTAPAKANPDRRTPE